MGIVLGPNRYGKAENRVVRVVRDTPRHEIRDLNVSTSLWGDFTDAHVTGDQSHVLPTDSQRNTVFAYAKQRGIGEIEDYALDLAHHFVDAVESVSGARVQVEEYGWDRIRVDGAEHDHSFVRTGQDVRTAEVTVTDTGSGRRAWVVSGLHGLTVLKSTGSEFAGFLRDDYTTLAETRDRVLATSLVARWRFVEPEARWGEVYREVRQTLLATFASVHSLALQQSLWEMGKAVLAGRPEIAEIRLSAPNKHHIAVDLGPFGLDNPNEVFHATDRPYGLIQASVTRDDAPAAGPAWDGLPEYG